MRHFLNRLRRYPVKERVDLDSAALQWVEYHPGHQSLDVGFQSGSHYRYGCVDPYTYHHLLDSDSKGKFFVAKLRDRYPCMRLND